MMPYQAFLSAAEALNYDIHVLAQRFNAGFEQVCHRLTTLQRPNARGIPFFLLRVDNAGNVSKRFSSGTFPFSKFGGTCPLWNVHSTFDTPDRLLKQVIELPDGTRYFSIAQMVRRPVAPHPLPQPRFAMEIQLDEIAEKLRLDPIEMRLKQLVEPNSITVNGLRVSSTGLRECIERAAEHWFTSGPVVDAVLASAAVPGLLPPAKVGDEHYLDGGIVNSIPLGRAVRLGADRVFVLQVGRIDRPLTVPRKPWEVARVSFEIARRHRFVRELDELPEGVEAHVLPARGTSSRDDSLLAHRDFGSVERRIEETYEASREYLSSL